MKSAVAFCTLVAILFGSIMLSGGPAAGQTVIYAPGPPPAVRVEPRPAAPYYGAIWVGGHWAWQGRWVWIPGYWVRGPQPGAVWVPGHWVARPGGWVWIAGHWR